MQRQRGGRGVGGALVPDARLIPELHHQEAAEVAHYGAKVLHPRALIPIAGTRIALHVRSFVNPDLPGTQVTARHVEPGFPVKALAILHDQAVVTVAGKGMVGVHGIAARTFAAVDAARLSVSTIFQGSSESSIGFTVAEGEAEARIVFSIRTKIPDDPNLGIRFLERRYAARWSPRTQVTHAGEMGVRHEPPLAERLAVKEDHRYGRNVARLGLGFEERAVDGDMADVRIERSDDVERLNDIGADLAG